MEDSIFTKIINGEIPCHKVYEDDSTLAFLDIEPTSPGHTLVIPKRQVELVWDLEDDDYQAVMAVTKQVAQRIKDVLGVKFVGSKVVGTDVPHAHVHVFPISSSDQDISHIPAELTGSDQVTLARMADKLRF